jgi:hypothetical protein
MYDARTIRSLSTISILRAGQGSRPEVRVVRDGDLLLVVKDYSVGNRWLKLIGRVLLPREYGAYQRLEGLPGVPKCYGCPTPLMLVIEFVESQPSSQAPLRLLTPQFFAELRELVDTMHARGMVHGDMKRLDNILVDPQGHPTLIDFSAAFLSGSSVAATMVMGHVWDDDLRAITKLKLERTPHLVTPEEEAFYRRRSLVERWFRWSREYVRRPLQWLAGSDTDPRPWRRPKRVKARASSPSQE